MDTFWQHAWPVGGMLLGVVAHIVKKVYEARKKDKKLHLKAYLMEYPYQTFLVFVAGIISYSTLVAEADPGEPVSALAAFFAGIAANSLGDIAGDRNERAVE